MPLTRDDILRIVEASATLAERMDMSGDPLEDHPEQADADLEAWRDVMADGDPVAFERRLALENWTPDRCRAALRVVQAKRTDPLMEWAAALSEIAQTALSDRSEIKDLRDWLRPFVLFAQSRMRDEPGSERLSALAWEGLVNHLVRRLSFVAAPVLEMKKKVAQGSGLWGWFRPTPEGFAPEFLAGLAGENFLRLLRDYPVLGRLLATATGLWIDATREFLRRLTADWEALSQTFGATGKLGPVRALTAGLSDAHRGGRTVIRAAFETGEVVYYKPRPLDLDAAFSALLASLNPRADLPSFCMPRLLVREGYGWMEEVRHAPCRSEKEIERFYQRAGFLLGLIYGFGGTDFHHENWIACGEYPVPIDLETLMLPAVGEDDTFALRSRRFAESVLRTHFLPRWDVDHEGRCFDPSGLRFRPPEGLDDNRRYICYPYVNERRCDPETYREEIVEGFRRAYRFLMANREALLAEGGVLAAFRGAQVRVIFQDTLVYDRLIEKTLQPRFLRRGIDRAIQLEFLLRPLARSDAQAAFWPRMKAETLMLDVLDVPYFWSDADGTVLHFGPKAQAAGCVTRSALGRMVDQMARLSEEDLARQVAFIRGSFALCNPAAPTGTGGEIEIEETVPVSREALVAAAAAIGDDLCRTAIWSEGRSVTWYLPEPVQAEEGTPMRYAPADLFLYGGRSGIGLFLAALARFAERPDLRRIALAALHPAVEGAQDRGFRRYVEKHAPLGAGEGIGSLMYALTRIGRWLDAPDMIEAARHLAQTVTPEKVARDDRLDLLSGTAGALLGLLSLYAATGDEEALNRAASCGQHLLDRRVAGTGKHRAWLTLGGKRVAGMGHGAAGIAYALLRLYGATGRIEFRDAAEEGFASEQEAFSDTAQNWRGFGSSADDPVFLTAFCHGAPGIGLARLGGLGTLDTPRIRAEIETALHTTEGFHAENYDHLCCGHAGRLELMAVGASRLGRPEWLKKARMRAGWMLTRREIRGGFRLFDNLPLEVGHAGFFKGTAGIGYQFLRLADPDRVPSVLLWE